MNRCFCRCFWLLMLVPAGCSSPSSGASVTPAATPTAASSSAETPWVPVRVAAETSLLEMPAQVVVPAEASGAVTPPFVARLVRVHVRVGQRVSRGAAVVDVVMPQLVSSAGAYLAARTRVEAYTRRKAQLEALRAEGLARVAELADVETRLAEARADQQTALATLRIAGVSPDEAARVLDSSGAVALRSPIEGTVVELAAAIGETRNPGGRPIVRIAGAAPPRIEARLSHALPDEARFAFVLGARRVPVTLISQAPAVDSRDGTRAAWFEPSGPANLLPGQTGRLHIQLAAESGAVVVPSRAVAGNAATAGGAYVVRRTPGGSEHVSVEVLASSGADALVRGALRPTDHVAADVGQLDGTAK